MQHPKQILAMNPRTQKVASWGWVGLVYLLFALVFLRDLEDPRENLFWLNRVYDSYLVGRSLLMGATALWMNGILVILFLSRSLYIRLLANALIIIGMTLHLGYKYFVNGRGFTLHDSSIIVVSIDMASDAIAMYGAPFFWILCASTVVCFVLSSITWHKIRRLDKRWSLLLIPTILVGGVFVWHAAGKHNFFPIPFRIPSLFSANLLVHSGPRKAVRLAPVSAPEIPAIIFIVDESVRGDHLSINGYPRDTTPYLATRLEDIANFGLASSAGNSSYSSIAVLFSGIRMEELETVRFEYQYYPSILQYSRAAGFETHIVLGQNYQDIFHPTNSFSTIDAKIKERAMCDRTAADRLVKLIANEDRVFVFTQKTGAHFPYEYQYPQDRKRFRPTLEGYSWSDDLLRGQNSYDNAVAWTCDDYFAYLMPQLEKLGKDVLLIYTSDHGQVVPGTIRGLAETQAFTKDNYPASAIVPLFVWGTGHKAQTIVKELQKNTSAWNNTTHFDIFPTLLRLMGYNEAMVKSEYGISLFDNFEKGRSRKYIGGVLGVSSIRIHEFNLDALQSENIVDR